MKNVHIIGGDYDYSSMFEKEGWKETSLIEASLICFTGGEDVSPHLYNEGKHPQTYNNPFRDEKEEAFFKEALKLNIPMVGICRGGQFLNVMSGGSMYQHVTNHCGNHEMYTLQGETILVSSTHHQMMWPSEKGTILAFGQQNGIKENVDRKGNIYQHQEGFVDPEVVFYPHTKCLCFQPHPEFVNKQFGRMTEYFFECIRKLIVKRD